jgi:predicted metal-dependent hydrolase
MAGDTRALLDRGIDLFNREEYFEAHDVWEEAWRREEGDRRRFLQGLIQIAAGFVKLQRRQPRGARSLLERGAAIVAAHAGESFDLDLPPLLESVSRWRAFAEESSASGEYAPGALAPPRLGPPGRPRA